MFRMPLPVLGLTLATVALSACAGGTSGNGAPEAGNDAKPPIDRGVSAPAPPPIVDEAPGPGQPDDGRDDGPGACDPAKAQSAVGKVATQAVVDAAVAATGAKGVRVIKPGMAVTMDFRADRLNIDVDAKNVVTGLRCG